MIKMDNYGKILRFAEENSGYITSKEASRLNINSTFLCNLVNAKQLERVVNGIYKLSDYPDDNLYVLSNTSKNICYSHATALYLHNLSDRIPQILDVTVPYNYSGRLLNDSSVDLHYVKNDIFELGIIEIKTINNLTVKCYDLERTICDVIRDKDEIDKELYSKALKEYASSKDKNILKLIKYAKKLNVEKEVAELMEVLL